DPIRRQVLARARYAEDKLREALDSGIRQYVIIGAGLDSFALRRSDLDGKINIYELDHPATQQAKKARVKELNLCLPENHEFVPVDFEKENICEALDRSSYDPKSPAFFSWLGTVHYISQPAVFKTLTSIQSCAGLESELVFDYAISEKHYSHQDHKTVNDLKRYTKRRGEPILSTFDPDIFPQQVSQLGFVLMENVSPEEQAKRYFNATDRGEKIMPGSYFIHFRVMGK
ncbi:MAG: SAM-dependent methyltransferase, partial [Desulfobacterium sp.]|nr:SAM-dependent methyltransferase [Desulfobacterium sp.]